MFPSSAGVNACGIGKCFKFRDFLSCQLNLGSLGSLDDVTFLRGSDDGQCTLGDGPGDAYSTTPAMSEQRSCIRSSRLYITTSWSTVAIR